MIIKSKKARRIFWEVRRHVIIFLFYAVSSLAFALLMCIIVGLPEIIASLFF